MSKWLAVGMAGFLLGLKCRECSKRLCSKRIRRQMMKLLGL